MPGRRHQAGQATTETLLTMSFLFLMLFGFVHLSMFAATKYLVNLAAFSAARTAMVAGNEQQAADGVLDNLRWWRDPSAARPRLERRELSLRGRNRRGLTQKQLKQLRPEDVFWRQSAVKAPARHKGQGASTQVLPVTRRALEALPRFAELACWGAFSTASLNRSFQRACKKVGLSGKRAYDFRHTFGTEMYRRTHDPLVVQQLMLHRSSETTRRYILGPVPDALQRAVNAISYRPLRGRYDEGPSKGPSVSQARASLASFPSASLLPDVIADDFFRQTDRAHAISTRPEVVAREVALPT